MDVETVTPNTTRIRRIPTLTGSEVTSPPSQNHPCKHHISLDQTRRNISDTYGHVHLRNQQHERRNPRRQDGPELRGGRERLNSSVDGRFAALDTDRDGLLSYSEMARELMSLRVLDRHFGVDEAAMSPDELVQLYRGLYARFDHDGNGAVDLGEFRAEMKEVMLAVANGLGFLPVQMVVEEGSFLKVAVDRELAKAA
ncbi:hypothetical protein GUJ93_ZPchr0009g1065 [Zizania palustris]|uniref:EF-hand domain-containing protein n=1 Tax=Zizania palustris TaxID=103762 RepID=A0A8J5V381_ZIZPA|nr:hypothetical protein GUJ93_ZPchr0009g1065 [Zizania palustris]